MDGCCLIVPNRDGYIEPHCARMLAALEGAIEVMREESSALLEFFRSEALERAFACGFKTVVFFDSDCSADPSELLTAIEKTHSAKRAEVRSALFPDRMPGGGKTIVGRGLQYLNPPLVRGKRPVEQDVEHTVERRVLFGAAFVAINALAWKALTNAYPERAVALSPDFLVHPLWKSLIIEEAGERLWLGEDYSFFWRVHEARVPVVLDPLDISHGRGEHINRMPLYAPIPHPQE